jgi:hypothetical protein
LNRVVDRTARVGEQQRLWHVETKDRRASFEADHRAACVREVVIEHPAQAGIGEAKRSPDTTLARRGTRVERTVGTARRDVSLIEALEDVIGRVGRVEVIPLIEGEGLEGSGNGSSPGNFA